MSRKYKGYLIIMTAAIFVLNVLAWLFQGFCDWYADHIFWISSATYGRLMNFLPFSFGEGLLVAGAFLVECSAVLGIAVLCLRKKKKFMEFARIYFKTMCIIFLNVCLIMTLNCSILYHCSRLDPNTGKENREYTLDELETLYTYIVNQCNARAEKMQRDDAGYIVYAGDIRETAKLAMKNISSSYPRFAGYFPDVKDMFFSDLMSQSYMTGYYFPFSMEANANADMYILNNPETYCHELSHLKGYMYEDEANFLSFLACTKSNDVFFQYSGYIGVLNYIQNAYYESLDTLGADNAQMRMERIPKWSEHVSRDNIFLLPEAWVEVEQKSVMDTETVAAMSDTFTDTSIKMNGVEEGKASYGGVVELLLQYYDGILY